MQADASVSNRLWDLSALKRCNGIDATRWTACRGSALLWRSWDNQQSIVYHVESGDTHLLNHVAAQALRLLQDAPSNVSELAERVTAALGGVADETFMQHLGRLLAEFDESGLIEPCP